MAVDLLTDNPSSRGISPRISFSHDLKNSDIIPIESHIPLKPSSLLDYDFDFCVSKTSYDHDSSSADELFSNGVILPIQIKKENIPIISKSKSFTQSSQLPSSSSVLNNGEKTEEKQGNNNKSFWMFKRSKSLNCSSIYRKGLCSLYILSRSKSTGSTISGKRSLISNDETHHQQQNGNGKQSSLKNLSSSYHQKPPIKKNYGGSSFNSGLIQVSPVLNVPTGKVFGFGSLFSTATTLSNT
ncbi:uncharacterized protein LOC130802277 [Amaranthus tricolor]|uniref:uncharacterized protein LOC130802277 n=1 Tax=Amaranthus tricolor TaxID=29722 RepID=UPI00258F9D02|nr:uncharacterized protein LOC130802277 [Amaranthus tricolor]